MTIAKVVTGSAGDQTKKFNFAIEMKDQSGNPVNGEYAYIGSVYPGHENEAAKPEDGVLQFMDGKAQIQLSHGQQITIKDLPYQSRYTVTETDQDGYDTTYNKGEKPENDLLDEDKTVFVENYKSNSGGGDSHHDNTQIKHPSNPSKSSKSVKTGDTTHIMTYGFIAVGSLLLILALIYFRKHRQKK